MRHEQFPRSIDARSDTVPGPVLGIVNGVLGSLAMWAVIAGVVVAIAS